MKRLKVFALGFNEWSEFTARQLESELGDEWLVRKVGATATAFFGYGTLIIGTLIIVGQANQQWVEHLRDKMLIDDETVIVRI